MSRDPYPRWGALVAAVRAALADTPLDTVRSVKLKAIGGGEYRDGDPRAAPFTVPTDAAYAAYALRVVECSESDPVGVGIFNARNAEAETLIKEWADELFESWRESER